MSAGRARLALACIALAAVVAACSGDDDAASVTPDGSSSTTTSTTASVAPPTTAPFDEVVGDLHPCASELPLPDGALIVDGASADIGGGERTCVVRVALDDDIPTAVDLLGRAFDDAGWVHEIEQRDASVGLLRVRSPRCATVVVVPAAEAFDGEAELAEGRPTGALLSLHTCDEP